MNCRTLARMQSKDFQLQLTRVTTPTTTPSNRRQGLTPRNNSSADHVNQQILLMTTTAKESDQIQAAPRATRHSRRRRLGCCATTTLPVERSSNHHLRDKGEDNFPDTFRFYEGSTLEPPCNCSQSQTTTSTTCYFCDHSIDHTFGIKSWFPPPLLTRCAVIDTNRPCYSALRGSEVYFCVRNSSTDNIG